MSGFVCTRFASLAALHEGFENASGKVSGPDRENMYNLLRSLDDNNVKVHLWVSEADEQLSLESYLLSIMHDVSNIIKALIFDWAAKPMGLKEYLFDEAGTDTELVQARFASLSDGTDFWS